MAFLAPILALAGHEFVALDASANGAGPSRGGANLALFLFGVLGLLLFLFFMIVVLTSVARAMRRKKAATNTGPTDMSVDAWSESGKRLGKPTTRRGRSEPS